MIKTSVIAQDTYFSDNLRLYKQQKRIWHISKSLRGSSLPTLINDVNVEEEPPVCQTMADGDVWDTFLETNSFPTPFLLHPLSGKKTETQH